MLSQSKTSNSTAKSANNKQTPQKHHRIRTFFASIFGIIALLLILFSIIVVWVNRTLTDTNTYVSTVAPLVTKPAIQNFVAEKVSQQLLDSKDAPISDIATTLLPAAETAGKTPDQLKALVEPIIRSSVLQIVSSPSFASLWQSTNRSAHAALVSQLEDNNATQITLNFNPLVQNVIMQLKTTQLAPVSDKINLKADAGEITLRNGSSVGDVANITQIHKIYTRFKQATLAIVAATILAIICCVWLSVHHLKTLRRILLGTGIIALVLALLLQAPSLVKLKGSDPVQQAAAVAIAKQLFHNLQVAMLILGVVCVLIAVGTKVYPKLHPRKA